MAGQPVRQAARQAGRHPVSHAARQTCELWGFTVSTPRFKPTGTHKCMLHEITSFAPVSKLSAGSLRSRHLRRDRQIERWTDGRTDRATDRHTASLVDLAVYLPSNFGESLSCMRAPLLSGFHLCICSSSRIQAHAFQHSETKLQFETLPRHCVRHRQIIRKSIALLTNVSELCTGLAWSLKQPIL